MNNDMYVVCADLEGVFVPEIWINVAEKTGIEELRLTTRDISDYNVLMDRRLKLLHQNNLKIGDIQAVIAAMQPLEGAAEFLDWMRRKLQVIVVSDTFVQFAGPLMQQLGWPTIFCHTLSIDSDGNVDGYELRQTDAKRKTARALKGLNYKVIAMGDSYNDIGMLQEADHAILFRPPQNVIDEYPQFPVTRNYVEIRALIETIVAGA